MADLILRDTDPDDLRRAIVADVLDALRPMLGEAGGRRLVDGDRLAERLSVSRPMVDRMRADGRIPSVLVGRRRLYCPDTVLDALQRENEKGAADA